MGNRRFAQAPTSDDEDFAPPPRDSTAGEGQTKRKRKKVHLPDEEEEEEEEKVREEAKLSEENAKRRKKQEEPEPETQGGDDEQEEPAITIGDMIRFSGKGRGRRRHYAAFEYDGIQYQLEDPVLLVPEQTGQKPYVAIIKDITQTVKGAVMVTGQWFYRPEEAEKRGGGNWQSSDTRELFYSFHRDEVPAESVMHKCVVHFIPLDKQIPNRKQHPGFIVQKVYDTEQRRLFKLTDKDYEDNKQHEIDLLVQKTLARLPDLPDRLLEDSAADHEDQMKNKRLLRKRNMPPLDISREDEGLVRSQSFKSETPGSTTAVAPEYHAIFIKFGLATGETQRDKWLEKLLQSVQFMCIPVEGRQNDEKERSASDIKSPSSKNNGLNNVKGSHSTNHGGVSFEWPDAAVGPVGALEKAAHELLSADFQKYNQKMRQLVFNLKNTAVLARRLLNGELDPAQILNMSPNELKEGLTAEEIAKREPEESGRMQMTDARCKRCLEKQVGLKDIIQTGHGDRYQLECVACGNTWYASRDDASTLTIEALSNAKTVGAAPLATAKFEDVEKNLVSPHGSEKGAGDLLRKTTEAYMPVLDNQKSFNKTRAEENQLAVDAK